MLYPLLRPILFQLDPETAHNLTMRMLRISHGLRLLPLIVPRPPAAPVTVMGIHFPNAVGLAAGLDKNGSYIDALDAMGFGFVEIGTITPRPQAGNPRPRMFRLPQQQAIINRMGFNNLGVDALVAAVKHRQSRGILGINIGKNADTPIEQAVADYLICMEKVYPHASYITVNISSPNTKNLRQLQHGDALGNLLATLKARQQRLADQHGHYVPLAIKIAPDLEEEEIRDIARLLINNGIDAAIAGNTTLARNDIAASPHAAQSGGLSGRPLTGKATRLVSQLGKALDGALPIIGVGGILSGQDAIDKIDAGAALVQLYSGLVYCGPGLIAECAKAIAHHPASE